MAIKRSMLSRARALSGNFTHQDYDLALEVILEQMSLELKDEQTRVQGIQNHLRALAIHLRDRGQCSSCGLFLSDTEHWFLAAAAVYNASAPEGRLFSVRTEAFVDSQEDTTVGLLECGLVLLRGVFESSDVSVVVRSARGKGKLEMPIFH